MPAVSEADPPSDADDDFDTEEGLRAREAEYEAAFNNAVRAGVPTRRSGRATAAAATAAMDAVRQREREPLPGDQ